MEEEVKQQAGAPPVDSTGALESILCKQWPELTRDEKKLAANEVARRVGFASEYASRWFDGYHKEVETAIQGIIKPSKFRLLSVLLAGPVGTGKTSMLCAMFKGWWINSCNDLAERGKANTVGTHIVGGARTAIFLSFENYVDMVMAEIDAEKPLPSPCNDDLKEVAILIVDDLLDPVPSGFQLSRLEHLIEARSADRLPTWFTTNHEKGKLETWPGFERSYSRLAKKEWCRYFELTGDDRRRKS